jgi:hypothetical protein
LASSSLLRLVFFGSFKNFLCFFFPFPYWLWLVFISCLLSFFCQVGTGNGQRSNQKQGLCVPPVGLDCEAVSVFDDGHAGVVLPVRPDPERLPRCMQSCVDWRWRRLSLVFVKKAFCPGWNVCEAKANFELFNAVPEEALTDRCSLCMVQMSLQPLVRQACAVQASSDNVARCSFGLHLIKICFWLLAILACFSRHYRSEHESICSGRKWQDQFWVWFTLLEETQNRTSFIYVHYGICCRETFSASSFEKMAFVCWTRWMLLPVWNWRIPIHTIWKYCTFFLSWVFRFVSRFGWTIDYGCEKGCCPVPTSSVTILVPYLLSTMRRSGWSHRL